jgi:hypothetical protein
MLAVSYEPFAKLGKTDTPAQAGIEEALVNLDCGFRRKDEKGFLQEPPPPRK